MRYFLPLMFGSLLGCSSAYAADACRNAITTPELNACAQQELDAAELKLNRSYQQLLRQLAVLEADAPGTREAVRVAQRAWVEFREKDCRAQYTLHASGTIRNLTYLGCMREHAELRVRQLQDFNAP